MEIVDKQRRILERLLQRSLISAPPGLESLAVSQSKLNFAILFQRQQALLFRYAWVNFKIRYLKGVLKRAVENGPLLNGDFLGGSPLRMRTFGTLFNFLFFRAVGAKGVLSNLAVAAPVSSALIQNVPLLPFVNRRLASSSFKHDARFRRFHFEGSFRTLHFKYTVLPKQQFRFWTLASVMRVWNQETSMLKLHRRENFLRALRYFRLRYRKLPARRWRRRWGEFFTRWGLIHSTLQRADTFFVAPVKNAHFPYQNWFPNRAGRLNRCLLKSLREVTILRFSRGSRRALIARFERSKKLRAFIMRATLLPDLSWVVSVCQNLKWERAEGFLIRDALWAYWVAKRQLVSLVKVHSARLISASFFQKKKYLGYVSTFGPFIFCGAELRSLYWKIAVVSSVEKCLLKVCGVYERFGRHPFVSLNIAQYFFPTVHRKLLKVAPRLEFFPVQNTVFAAQERFKHWSKHCSNNAFSARPLLSTRNSSYKRKNVFGRRFSPLPPLPGAFRSEPSCEHWSRFTQASCKKLSVRCRRLYVVRTKEHSVLQARIMFAGSLQVVPKRLKLTQSKGPHASSSAVFWELFDLVSELIEAFLFTSVVEYFKFKEQVQKNSPCHYFFFWQGIWRGLPARRHIQLRKQVFFCFIQVQIRRFLKATLQ
jgi:hypothetical protein